MTHQPRRGALAVRAGVLVAPIAALLDWAAGPPSDTWRALASAVEASRVTPDFDQLLGSSAALAAWVGLGWLSVAVFLEVASVLPGAAGRGFAAVAAKTSPMLIRRIVQAAIGVSVLAGPLTAGSALAAGPSTNTSTSTQVDRPNALTPAPADASLVPLTLDRPATAFVAPPPAATRTFTGSAAIVTGVAHRGSGDRDDRSTAGYVVRRGDTLWDIAARHLGPSATAVDISRAWPAWYDANRAVIGPDPGVIRPGELLSAPSASMPPASSR
jgi:nucleoid-associated protein YgaU